jgi:hypothetical protein
MLPVVLGLLGLALVASTMEQPVFEQPECALVSGAKPPGGLGNLVENGLEPHGACDRAKDTADRMLLLTHVLEPTREIRVIAGLSGHTWSLSRSTGNTLTAPGCRRME